ncbi:hypothetical protein BH20VER1_BH20VER1_25650 [soil metagenome]
MIRNILAVIAGNVAWTVLWLSYNALLKSFGALPADSAAPLTRTPPLLMLLVGSVVFSVVAGFLTAAIATGQTYWPVLVLCAVQLAMGLFFQLQFWQLMPLWYHLPFLLLLVPATLLGAWLRLK